jgi:hypothetical protein
MSTDKDKESRDGAKPRKGARREFEVAYYTKELGRPLQRKLLQQQLADFTDTGASSAPGEDDGWDGTSATPRHDRAG